MKTSRWPISHLPISGVTPFTYRDGETYLSMLNRLAQYVTEQLHPSLRETVEHIVEELEHILAAQHGKYVEGIQDFQRIHDAFMTDVNSALMALNDNAVSDLVEDPGSVLGGTLRELLTPKAEFDVLRDTIMADIRLQSVTPQEFGAVGDGVQDDSQALQDAIDYAQETGTIVRLLPVTYKVDRPLYVTAPVEIHGAQHGHTILDASGIRDGSYVLTAFGSEHIHKLELSGFTIDSGPSRGASGIALGSDGADTSIRRGVSAFNINNVRLNDLKVGIRARFSWMGEISNTQISLVENPLEFGSQVNAVTFNTCTIRSFTGRSRFINCETITFNNLNLVHAGAYDYAFDIGQSNLLFVSPYFEYVNKLARVGRPSDIIKSSFVTMGGRICGIIWGGVVDAVVRIQSPWYVRMGNDPYYGEHFEYPEEKLVVRANADDVPAYPSRFLHIDRDRSSPLGMSSGYVWSAGEDMTLLQAFGGVAPVWTHHDTYSTISANPDQGFRLPLDVEPNIQYMLAIRVRAQDSSNDQLAINFNGVRAIPIAPSGSGFETQYLPIMSDEGGSIRFVLSNTTPSIDLQFISLVKGLQPIEY